MHPNPMKSTMLVIAFAVCAFAAARPYNLPIAYSASGPIRSGTIHLKRLRGGSYSLLLSVPPQASGSEARLEVELVDGGRQLITKTLHAGDADLYAPFHLGKS